MNRYTKKVDQFAAAPMFVVSILFLAFFAGMLHLRNLESEGLALAICEWSLFLLYPCFIIEAMVHLALGSPRWKLNLLFCLVPPLRITARDQMTGRAIWFPILAWTEVDKQFCTRVRKTFSAPMLVIALLVLPLFAVEHYWQKQIESSPMLADLAAMATGFIWFAFTLEFIIMISIEQKRLDYCRKHWIDLAVICLPMIAFLRTLRITGSAMRLQRLARLQQLTRSARIFRLKSLVMKLYRALLVLEIVNRFLHRNPEKRIARLEELLLEKEQEMEAIRSEMRLLSERIALNSQTETEAESETVSITQRKAA
ncbi:hypothetical protein [Gimesia panareensis]|uniref:hypothetical protein n=1 Tax=Gimesia panareensis TaxID=2527978 RepID=UPI00118CBAAD|nr:hypothetical protein [Gimesia panareensis]QDU51059.1 hypothetical protein Pan110_34200 [Gimesia panareensis]